MKYIIIFILFGAFSLNAQVKGVVFSLENGKQKEPVAYAQIQVLGKVHFLQTRTEVLNTYYPKMRPIL